MPFPKLRLKKSRQQYNVASKSVFVITVELLDNAVLECTLSAESTGRDCMDNVCQRLGLQQPDLFGLRYVSRRSYPKIRWVDLDRPLKKQLDKYSQEPYLYLGVIFYVTDVSLLEDEVTRYHYFLQLKMDVVEGRLRCNYEQAIVLASYSLQAEFGDHDPEKHTAEYLKDFPLLPKPMISQFDDRLSTLTDAIITQHASLTGIAQQLAEVYYIVGAQQLDGYGQECFLAKDDTGNEVLIGASLIGIVVRKGNGQSPQFFKWNDITNLVNHKRYFGIECQNFEYSVQFVFDEPDAAKYVWKMCVLQHTFYKMHQSAAETSELNITLEPPSHLSFPDQDMGYRAPPGPAIIKPADIKTFQRQSQNIPAKVEFTTGHSPSKMVVTMPSVLTASKSEYSLFGNSNSTYNVTGPRATPSVARGPRQSSSHLQSNTSLNMTDPGGGGTTFGGMSGARSANDLDQLSQTVPTYRPAPDYDTAVRAKYGPSTIPPAMLHMYSSHPEIRPSFLPGSGPGFDVGFTAPMQTLPDNSFAQQEFNIGFPLQTSHTYSTPELNTGSDSAPLTDPPPDQLRLSVYQPPPPYPHHAPPPHQLQNVPHHHHQPFRKHSSNSTPDLASQTLAVGQVGGSSPDLVSRRNLGPAAGRPATAAPPTQLPNPDVHRTYDNLTNINQDVTIGQDINNVTITNAGQEPYSRQNALAYSTEELNSVYNLNDQNDNISQFHNIINNDYNAKNIVNSQQLQQQQQLHLQPQQQIQQTNNSQQLQHLQPQQTNFFPGQQLDQQQIANILAQQQLLQQQSQDSDNQDSEPIYQNQGQIFAQQMEITEPIYQNIPLHEKLLESQDDNPEEEILEDETVEGVELFGRINHVSRIAITNSREDLNDFGDKSYQRQFSEPVFPPNQRISDQLLANQVISDKLLNNQFTNDHLSSSQIINDHYSSSQIISEQLSNNRKSSETVLSRTSPDKGLSTSFDKGLSSSFSNSFDKPRTTPERPVSRIDKSLSRMSPEKPANISSTKISITSNGPDFSTDSETDDRSVRKSADPVETKSTEPRKKIEMRQYLEPAVIKQNNNIEDSLISSLNIAKISDQTSNTQHSQQKSSSPPYSSSHSQKHSSSNSQHSQPGHWTPTPPFQGSYGGEVNYNQGVEREEAKWENWANKGDNTLRKKSVSSLHSSGNEDDKQSQPRSKGRKRWGLNMAVKSGSLKSIKSDGGKSDSGNKSGDDTRQSSGRGMGAMMLANLHGLTRSRPDILNESYSAAFQAPAKIPKDEIGAYLESKLAEGEVVREFEKIPKKKTTHCNTNVALVGDNIPRNRFKDVVPYDENRVKIINDKENKYGYVNASHISATVGDQQRFYIAAQGPMANTVLHFWSMIQECDVHLVVMLTEVSGASKTSACIPYWPQNDGSSLEIGDFQITKKFSSTNGSYSTSTLALTHVPTRRTRTVWHLQYTSWHDHGCPDDVHTFLQFLEELSALRRHTVSEVAAGKNRNTPVLVHCSAGVGRTGVTILCDILLYCLDHNIDIDIPKVLTHLRQQRMMMVQTVAQYKFVHTVLINYLGQSRLI